MEKTYHCISKESTEIMKKYGVCFRSGYASMSIAENIALVLETIKDLDNVTLRHNKILNSIRWLDGFQDFFTAEISVV
jgi:ABC-type transporter Mla maintaining outer membrane lipid asymmetry ATPase subunit MlaF